MIKKLKGRAKEDHFAVFKTGHFEPPPINRDRVNDNFQFSQGREDLTHTELEYNTNLYEIEYLHEFLCHNRLS